MLRITVWYPAASGTTAQPLVIGTPEQARFEAGSAAPAPPFAADPGRTAARGHFSLAWVWRERPVDGLVRHGAGGNGLRRGFGQSPGNNGIYEMTVPGALLS